MPDTPIYGITFPCESAPVSVADFSTFATDVEAALVTTDAEARTVTHLPTAKATGSVNPAFGVETAYTYLLFPASVVSTGITLNAAAGTFTIITPGVYSASVRAVPIDSTLTVTSSRVAVTVNGTNVVSRKYRGFNPPDPTSLSGSYTADVFLAAGDVVTFRLLWTGTGALLSPAQASFALDLLATP